MRLPSLPKTLPSSAHSPLQFPCDSPQASPSMHSPLAALAKALAGSRLLPGSALGSGDLLAAAGVVLAGNPPAWPPSLSARLRDDSLALLLALAAAAAAAARAWAAVFAALSLRYCMAADMALATRGGALDGSRDSFSLRSSAADETSSWAALAPADAAVGSGAWSALSAEEPVLACGSTAADADAAIVLRLYSRALDMRAAASLLLAPPLLLAFMRAWKALILRSAASTAITGHALEHGTGQLGQRQNWQCDTEMRHCKEQTAL